MTKLSKTLPLENIQEAWEADCLDVKKVADYLTPVIGSIRQPFVISLNAPYGTGKTFFIRNWRKDLTDQGFKAVYFNAWETDYTDNALVAFISSIDDQLRDSVSEAASLIKAGAGYIAQKSLIALAKGVARKCVGDETVKELVDLASLSEEDIAGFASTLAEDAFKKHKEVTKSVEDFKVQLGAFVQQISDKADHDDKKKLIIYVDELDRCRPTYAVEVLECIKHLFNVPGVVFVLAVDIDQLKATIAKTYGAPDDGEGYLRKFIDWQLNLPKLSRRQFCEVLYGEFKLEETGKFTADNSINSDYRRMLEMIAWVADAYSLSLRTIAQIFTEINLMVRNLTGRDGMWATCLGCLAALLHTKDAGIVRSMCLQKKIDNEKVATILASLSRVRFPQDLHSQSIANSLVWATFLSGTDNRAIHEEVEQFHARKDPLSPDEKTRYEFLSATTQSRKAYSGRYIELNDSIAHIIYSQLEKTSFLLERS